jgi:sodium pump decarboxylase gamma subunit
MTEVFAASTWWEGVKGPLADAGVNTIVGLCIVFAALIFISFIISLFKYIGKLDKSNEKKAVNNAPAVATQQSGNELNIDNFELVAVITAAISEFEESRGNFFKDGIVVRSVKKIS